MIVSVCRLMKMKSRPGADVPVGSFGKFLRSALLHVDNSDLRTGKSEAQIHRSPAARAEPARNALATLHNGSEKP